MDPMDATMMPPLPSSNNVDGNDPNDIESEVMQTSMLAKGGAGQTMRLLPEDFVPGEHDVICGRGRRIFMHAGNVRFRRMVEDCLEEYSSTVTKMEKTFILGDIIAQVRANSPDGGFVKKDPKDNRWYEVGDYLAREKTSQAFRDALFDQYKSSNTAKKLRKRGEKMKIMPRRAYSSTSLLDSKKIASAESSSGGYTDPLIAKLRMSKSARSVTEFGERGGGSNASFGRPSVAMASCPNLSSGFHAAASSPHIGQSRNFDWGSGGGGGLGGGGAGGLSDNKNFEWGKSAASSSSSSSNAAQARPSATRKLSLDLLSSLTKSTQPVPPVPQFMDTVSSNNTATHASIFGNTSSFLQHGSGQVSTVSTSETEPGSSNTTATNFSQQQHSVGHNLGNENELLGLSLVLSPQKRSSSLQQQMQQQQNAHQLPAVSNIESKLMQLRETTFEGIGNDMFDNIGPLDGLITSITEEHGVGNSEIDVFDKLVDLVGDVQEEGDPFEPDPLP